MFPLGNNFAVSPVLYKVILSLVGFFTNDCSVFCFCFIYPLANFLLLSIYNSPGTFIEQSCIWSFKMCNETLLIGFPIGILLCDKRLKSSFFTVNDETQIVASVGPYKFTTSKLAPFFHHSLTYSSFKASPQTAIFLHFFTRST